MVFDAERCPIRHIRGDADIVICGGNERFGNSWDDSEPVDVKAAKPFTSRSPRLAAIGAAPHTVNFNPGVYRLVVARVDNQCGYSRNDWYSGTLVGKLHIKLLPCFRLHPVDLKMADGHVPA